jgi:hypothetical protein
VVIKEELQRQGIFKDFLKYVLSKDFHRVDIIAISNRDLDEYLGMEGWTISGADRYIKLR